MKKILFVISAIVAMSFASCGNTAANYGVSDSDTVVVEDSVVVDSVLEDTVVLDSVVLDTLV